MTSLIWWTRAKWRCVILKVPIMCTDCACVKIHPWPDLLDGSTQQLIRHVHQPTPPHLPPSSSSSCTSPFFRIIVRACANFYGKIHSINLFWWPQWLSLFHESIYPVSEIYSTIDISGESKEEVNCAKIKVHVVKLTCNKVPAHIDTSHSRISPSDMTISFQSTWCNVQQT